MKTYKTLSATRLGFKWGARPAHYAFAKLVLRTQLRCAALPKSGIRVYGS